MTRLTHAVAAGAVVALAAVGVTFGPADHASAATCKVAALADVAGAADYQLGATANARMIAADPSVTRILVAGDLAYEDGTEQQFRDYWRPAFGSQEAKVFAVPGNHEHTGTGLDGIEAELGDSADDNRGTTVCGSWRVVGVNPYKGVTSAVNFIKAERGRYPNHRLIVLWHAPAYSSGMHGGDPASKPLFDAARTVKARIVINGHDHNYERFSTKDGVRQFVSGLGGHGVRPLGTTASGSAKRYTGQPGSLFLTLNSDGSYSWVFRTTDGTVRDSGSQS